MNCKFCKADCCSRGLNGDAAFCAGWVKMTNEDRIRSMSTKELAEWASIVENNAAATNSGWLPSKWIKWLKQECAE